MHGWLVLLRRQGPELYNLTTEKDLRMGCKGGKTEWVILAVIGKNYRKNNTFGYTKITLDNQNV